MLPARSSPATNKRHHSSCSLSGRSISTGAPSPISTILIGLCVINVIRKLITCDNRLGTRSQIVNSQCSAEHVDRVLPIFGGRALER